MCRIFKKLYLTTTSFSSEKYDESFISKKEGFEIDDSNSLYYSRKHRFQNIATVLNPFKQRMKKMSNNFLGFPSNFDIDFNELKSLFNYPINNVGDPFVDGNVQINTKRFEVGVLNWFSKLWHISKDDYWGYITNGGTEGNMYGIYLARENFPDAILYTSDSSHYSVFKAAKMYRMECKIIPSIKNGEIDYEMLEDELKKNKDKSVILNLNLGTTMTGAVDDIDRILKILKDLEIGEDRFYVHCDGALAGLMVPFINEINNELPLITFEKPIGSISVSGHKFLGVPFPCGVVITRSKYVEKILNDIEYIGDKDTTLSGSRNGHSALFLWYRLMMLKRSGLKKQVLSCMRKAKLLKVLLEQGGIKCILNKYSTTVVFKKPSDDKIVKKWVLSYEKEVAHVVVMPHIIEKSLKAFAKELIANLQVNK